MTRVLIATVAVTLAACAPSTGVRTLLPDAPELDARTIMVRAHAAAGGERWARPRSLALEGYAVFYRDGQALRHETHNMWRVYERGKRDAHASFSAMQTCEEGGLDAVAPLPLEVGHYAATRIESRRDGRAIIDVSFDGRTTYTADGAQPASAADAQWSSSFGYGVVRHALDPGYTLQRLPDDLVDGRAAWVVNVVDPAGGETRFAIRQDDDAIVRVGFDTPRGWHERIYSGFFSNPGERWRQPARVRLYYDGVKVNEVIWTGYTVNAPLPDCLFVLPELAGCRAATPR